MASIIKRIDLNKEDSYVHLLQELGEADFKNTVMRNVEKDYIAKQAALLSVTNLVVPYQTVNGLNTLMQSAAKGGVTAQFPIDPAQGDSGIDTSNEPLVTKQVQLSRANVTYKVSHEAIMEGGNIAENDAIFEGAEQLSADINRHFLTETLSKKFGGNDVAAANPWTTTGTPYDDINKAISKIYDNSALDPNLLAEGGISVIAPLSVKEGLNKITVVDGAKITVEELIRTRLKARILYTRPPFRLPPGVDWPLTTKALVVPTLDRHVGKFYTFSGGAMPNIFETVTEQGKRVSTNYWMRFAITPSEADGSLTENRRIGEIDNVAA